MKLLLTSGGLMNPSIVSALNDLTERPFSELNLAFIPTAANMEEGDKWWLIEDLESCKKLGFSVVDVVDISALPREIWEKRLESADILLVEGGNTYHLMYWLNKSGLSQLLPELLKSKVYVGISAGSIVVTPSLVLNKAEKEQAEKIGEIVGDKGLGFVDFLIEPHINNPSFPELTFDYVEEEAEKVSQAIYALDDNSAIQITDGQVTVISEGKWKKIQLENKPGRADATH